MSNLNSENTKDAETIPRSRLYSIQPIGVGTFYVESLTSYIQRLAMEHHVSNGVLISREIAPLVKQELLYKNAQGSISKDYARTHQLNGTCASAKNIVSALQKLTLRNDLQYLTLLTWSEVIDQKQLIKSTRSWCPSCYKQWKETDQIIYEPLIWFIEVVKICPIHYQPLRSFCPNCHRANRSLNRFSKPGYCYYCNNWLGTSEVIDENSIESVYYELESQKVVVNHIGNLIASFPYSSVLPSKERLLEVFTACANCCENNTAALGRIFNVLHVTAYNWVHGKSLPSINSLLWICEILEIPIFEFFLLKPGDKSLNIIREKYLNEKDREIPFISKRMRLTNEEKRRVLQDALNEIPPPSVKEVAHRHGYKYGDQLNSDETSDLYKLVSSRYLEYRSSSISQQKKSSLEEAIKGDEYPPKSMKRIAGEIGYTVQTLYKEFPELCRILSKRYKTYMEMCAIKSELQYRKQVWSAAIEIANQGMEPTEHLISQYIGNTIILMRPLVRCAIEEARSRLGYSR
jgi:transcriptional regulator with XRE-family HTH domain